MTIDERMEAIVMRLELLTDTRLGGPFRMSVSRQRGDKTWADMTWVHTVPGLQRKRSRKFAEP